MFGVLFGGGWVFAQGLSHSHLKKKDPSLSVNSMESQSYIKMPPQNYLFNKVAFLCRK